MNLYFNYSRTVLKVPRVSVPRIPNPKIKLPRYQVYAVTSSNHYLLRNLIAIHQISAAGENRYVYVHRIV